MKDFLHHLFIPRESNNHRAKLLHHKSLVTVILILFLTALSFSSLKNNFADVLGVTTTISAEELLQTTNKTRAQEGLAQLTLNDELSKAAAQKAQDMFSRNYWAHNAPDGTTPWVFIKQNGYTYVYAGENLARGFSTSQEVVDAWMASPSHRSNMLSTHYEDIGFGIAEGKLLGEDTVLVVEMFGSKTLATDKATTRSVASENIQVPQEVQKSPVKQTFAASIQRNPLIDSVWLSTHISVLILLGFILVLLLDMIIIERKKVMRLVGHNVDHIIFLGGICVLIVLFTRGLIL